MIRARHVVSAVVALVSISAGSRSALAQEPSSSPPPCGRPGRPGIVLRADGLDPALRASVTQQLRAALALRDFELCEDASSTDAVAVLDLSSAPSAGIAVTLAVRDDVTNKKVARDIDLRAIPRDGRALVIAQGADELLRASWAELLVPDAPKPIREVPAEVVLAVPAPQASMPVVPTRGAPVVEVGAAFALEHFGGGHDQLGADVSIAWFPVRQLGVAVRGGPRGSARVDAPLGDVGAGGFSAALGSTYAFLPRRGPAGIDAGAEMFVTHVSYDASAEPGAVARDRRGTALHASLVGHGWVVIAGPLRANLGLAVGAPIHGVRATGDGRTVSAVTGILLGAHLGVGGGW